MSQSSSSMTITNKQWRALRLAYPLYGTLSEAPDAALVTTYLHSFMTDAAPKLEQAFSLLDNTGFGNDTEDQEDSKAPEDERQPRWRQNVPRHLDALLMHLFATHGSDYADAKSSLLPPAVSRIPALTPRELQLMRLWHRERERTEWYYNTYMYLTEAVGTLGRTLIDLADTQNVSGAALPSPGATPRCSLNVSSRFLRSDSASGGNDGQGFLFAPRGGGGTAAVAIASAPTFTVCQGCGEDSGELFKCASCGCFRHEACGGPHPSEGTSGNTEGARKNSDSILLCKECRTELNMSSSPSQLRSSTSSSEREAIDAYFGADGSDDDDTSLSGFIVDTDEDEEGEEDEQRTSEDSGSSDESVMEIRRRAKEKSGTPGSGKSHGINRKRSRSPSSVSSAAARSASETNSRPSASASSSSSEHDTKQQRQLRKEVRPWRSASKNYSNNSDNSNAQLESEDEREYGKQQRVTRPKPNGTSPSCKDHDKKPRYQRRGGQRYGKPIMADGRDGANTKKKTLRDVSSDSDSD